jgi:DNA-binding NarL/FixJ family response regulator
MGAADSPLNGFSAHVNRGAGRTGTSDQQFAILNFYLEGKSDKEIAKVCQCSCATVYEHWSRMAKKSGRSRKSDVIADFHRFLRGG